MSISKGILEVLEKSSWIRKMFEEGIQLKQQYGEKNVFDLSLGNPLLEPPKKFKERIIDLSKSEEKGMHRYMPNPGFLSTRSAIAKNLNDEFSLNIGSEHVIVTTGAAGGLNSVLKTLLNPDDEIIIFSPFFVEYLFYVSNHNGKSVIAKTDENFLPDLVDLENKITEKTKAVIINSPNNPTGVLYPKEVIEKLSEVIKRSEKKLQTEIYLVSDEPYRKIIFDDKKYPFIFNYHDRSIVVTSHSKDLGLAGERIGYIIVSPKDKDREVLFDAIIFSLRTFSSLDINPLTPFSIMSGIMHVAVETTGVPQDIASSSDVGIGLYVEVFKKTAHLLYSFTSSSVEGAGSDRPGLLPTSLLGVPSVTLFHPS